ncbi:hypothetical protein CALCODRAFT_514089 [Calocera cornea HHB12733]|uniref:Inositol hexakisphosphate and diphosphoinositol-pentakisphosphate kinase n=1 Tax=Calocera cornea HHB12733 TaxID=1353952 RepID=A0A165JTG9_9BASI|nr:hypothetical protein CALCODRAFT_514089 [Calocera cornea HHB12733]
MVDTPLTAPSRPLSPAASDDTSVSSAIPSTPSVIVGICALDVKARSKAMREILTRLVQRGQGAIDIKIFGDKTIMDEEVENWPRCDILISFFSTDFPLPKAVKYAKLRNPVLINDLESQELLWDRRFVLAILDHNNVPTPKRLVATRDDGPHLSEPLRMKVLDKMGLDLAKLSEVPRPSEVRLREDGNAIIVDGQVLEKPYVEKPVSGEDHNVYIYYRGGGGRRLFRKVGNKSSEFDPTMSEPRTDGSYIYEEFLNTQNAEDIKVYTVGYDFTHAETRKSPVVDGVVRRNTEGKEIRFVTSLTEDERESARKICEAFGQRVCGFDVLRCEGPDGKQRSLVIDVNGWSFVKGNDAYYDKAAEILSELCQRVSHSTKRQLVSLEDPDPMSSSWILKANVTVFRHADRTPKQKLKFSFPVAAAWTKPFQALLSPEAPYEEIILRSPEQLQLISTAINTSKKIQPPPTPEELEKLAALEKALYSKIDMPGTKAQLKPNLEKGKGPKGKLEKLQLVFKWGGEFTHAARYQSRDLGEQLKKDISIMNKDVLNNVTIYTSSERRVVASADIFAAALFEGTLYSSQGADEPLRAHANSTAFPTPVSSYTSTFLANLANGSPRMSGNGRLPNSPSTSSLRASSTPPPMKRQSSHGTDYQHPLIVRKDLLDDSNAAKELTDDVKKRLKILLRPGEPEKRPELTWPKGLKKEPVEVVGEVIDLLTSFREIMRKNYATIDVDKIQQRWCCGDEPFLFRERWEKLFEDFCDVKKEKFDPSRVSELYDTIKYCALHHRPFLFAIFDPQGGQGPPSKVPDRRLHELYARSKALFDLVAPQEYGIDPWEKEEIGILTSLPLLKKVVDDLQTSRNTGKPLLSVYFTKESHIHTLANLILLSGLPMATPRIPELDYASHITFELYERNGGRGGTDKEYSIKLSLSEGAHSSNVLDSALDARHALNVQPRKKLTPHLDYGLVIEKLSKHFHRTVPVPGEDPPPGDPNLPLAQVLHTSTDEDDRD